jgi:hypothetical protein
MSTGLNLEPPSGGTEELLTPLAETTAASPVAIAPPPQRKTLPFGPLLSPERALHQGILPLADQAVASAANFLTGEILARTCSKEELGLHMLGFSLILPVTDLQTSLIATPYMIYAQRLKGLAHALYTGSSLIHQLALSLFTLLALAAGAVAVTLGAGTHG